MNDAEGKIYHAESMIHNELQLLDKEIKEGDEIEAVTGALYAVFNYTFGKAPTDMLGVNLITSVLSAVISDVTFSQLEKHNGN